MSRLRSGDYDEHVVVRGLGWTRSAYDHIDVSKSEHLALSC